MTIPKNHPPSQSKPAPGLLEAMTIEDVRMFRPEVVVIPLGSTEPHGPHLPYGTDTLIADSVSAEAVRLANVSEARVLRLPPLPFGNNVNFKKFPFACRVSIGTLMAVIGDLAAFSLEEGVRKIVIVNAHGGNDGALKATLRALYDRFQQEAFVCSCRPTSFCGPQRAPFNDQSPHAGDYETSMIHHIAPGWLVESARRPSAMKRPAISTLTQPGVEWIRPWNLFMPESYGGRPNDSSAEKGRQCLESSAAGLSRFLLSLSETPWHPNFPYAPCLDAP